MWAETDCPLVLLKTLPGGHWFVYSCPKCGVVLPPDLEPDPQRISRRCGAVPFEYPIPEAEPQLFNTGEVFKELAQALGFTACGFCEETRRKMNAKGPDWCAEHREELIAEVRRNIQAIADGTAAHVERLDKTLEAPQDEKAKELATYKRGWFATMGAKAAMVLKGTGHAIVNSVTGNWVPNPLAPGGVIGSMIDEAIKRSRGSTAG